MRWQNERRSENVEDRRGVPAAGIAVGGGIGAVILVVIALFLGADPKQVLNLLQNNQQAAPGNQPAAPVDPAEDKLADFVKVVLGETEDVWSDQFRKMNKEYKVPTLVLFKDRVNSACGNASAAVGPFYCPADQKVYIDLAFYHELNEIGHHVQNLLGISDKVRAQQSRGGESEGRELSVRLELQADFLAGVWAHHLHENRQILEAGDVEDGLRAASAIGDDRLQKESQGYVVPDSFTHGTSKQRVRWFTKGFKTGTYRPGDPDQGDTFSAEEL
jgi:uncharacterized protein